MSDAPKHGTLLEALHAFQAEAPNLQLDATNPHFKSRFVSLPEVTKIVRPILAKHGLVWTCWPSSDQHGNPALRYTLAHVTGQKRDGEMPLLLVKQDPQGLGSAITYARRYAMLAVLGLVGDPDDDGNAASTQAQGMSVTDAAEITGLRDQAEAGWKEVTKLDPQAIPAGKHRHQMSQFRTKAELAAYVDRLRALYRDLSAPAS